MAHLDGYLQMALKSKASDIHFSSGEPVRMRIDGELVCVDQNPLNSQQLQQILFEILTDAEKQKFLENHNLDKSYSVQGLGNFRVNVFMTRRGVAAVLRTIPTKIPTVEELNLPDTLNRLTEIGKGLILVTGPTGSGKSTTLAAMINYINQTRQDHILTAEDPVEFVHQSQRSLINQREIGNSCPSFADALKYALREDPDVILVGEMRDLETISLALTAAETGHMVFGTLHTRGAAASVDRIIDCFPADQQAMVRTMLSESLVAVISQVLLKKAGGQGRVAAYEIMVVNHAISNLIREGKTFQITSVIQTGKKDGMVLMDQKIRELVTSGVVSYEDAETHVENAATLAGLNKGRTNPIAGKPGVRTQNPSVLGHKSVTSPGGAQPKSPSSVPGAPPPMGARPPMPQQAAAPPGMPGKEPPGSSKAGKSFKPQPLTLGEETQAGFNIKSSPPPAPGSPSQDQSVNQNQIDLSQVDAQKFVSSGNPTLRDEEDLTNAGVSSQEKSIPAPPPIKKKVG